MCPTLNTTRAPVATAGTGLSILYFIIRKPTATVTNGTRRDKPRTAPHCRVLPPGEFNGVMPELLPFCSGSWMTIAVIDAVMVAKIVTKKHR